MKKKIKKKLDLGKIKIAKLCEKVDKKMQAVTIPPPTYFCTTTDI